MAHAFEFGQKRQLWTRQGHAGQVLFCRAKQDMLKIVLELIHPGNLGPLPPSPKYVAYKAEQTGIAKEEEFFHWR